jgi:hypothetical protein
VSKAKQVPARSRETYLDAKLAPKPEKARDVVNHKHVKNDRDRLAYSHKPRAVDFKPGTIKEFKRKNPRDAKQPVMQSLGKLPPDLQTDELLVKRANQARIKEFAANLGAHNRKMLKRASDTAQPRQHAREPSAREKALTFAKQVPKPKLRPANVLAERTNGGGPSLTDDQAKVGARTELSDIDQLLMRREAARADVDSIARELKAQGLG